MLVSGNEGEFIKWKKMQTKKVDTIHKDIINVLKNDDKKQFFKELFTAKQRGAKKRHEVINTGMPDDFNISGRTAEKETKSIKFRLCCCGKFSLKLAKLDIWHAEFSDFNCLPRAHECNLARFGPRCS